MVWRRLLPKPIMSMLLLFASIHLKYAPKEHLENMCARALHFKLRLSFSSRDPAAG
ncbi:hypothetical protein KC19_10G041800 [Ceratodon purpureus]|uniref:Uncharacterized protein n=1 Tax=Ceratodon purpureus TaxID=3225 RepID=A0A8T0GJ62_CERPU|nr:hypothetical protein KC19_10G041800 [Ceratodon purpureus]